MRHKRLGLAAVGIFILSASLAAAQTTWTVGTGKDFATITAAVADAGVVNGDTLLIDPGTFSNVTTTTISKSLIIEGSGVGQTIISHTGSLGNDVPILDVTAPDVTVRNLTITGGTYQGRGLMFRTSGANTILEDAQLTGGPARRAVWLSATASNFIMRDSVIDGSFYREAFYIRNPSLTITNNIFRQAHYQQGVMAFGGSAEITGTVSFNIFANPAEISGPGALDFGFDSAGAPIYSVSISNTNIGAGGLEFHNNTFAWEDFDVANASGNYVQIRGIEASLSGDFQNRLIIRDNIFAGYKFLPATDAALNAQVRPGQGQFGGALEFVSLQKAATFSDPLFDVGAQGTFNAWVLLENTGKRNQIFEGPGNGNMELQFRTNSGGQFYYRPISDTDYIIRSGGDAAIANATWTNLQVTWDQGSNVANLYVNGVESGYLANFTPADITGWTSAVNTAVGTMYLGADPGDSARGLDGFIDDVAFYNTVLSQTDRDTIRTGGVSTFSDANLVAHWDFDGPAGVDVVEDNKNSIDLLLDTPITQGIALNIPASVNVSTTSTLKTTST